MKKKEETYEEIADITDLIKHDFLMYALSNSKRSLPNIVDGLKPSQRRLIYAMRNEKGLTKSARVVGETLGKYHTHGDCLQRDTKFYLRNGDIKTIEELYLMGETVEILSVDCNGEIVPSKAYAFRIGQWTNKKYHIHLSNGGVVTATANHPFMSINKKWVRTEHLEVGQYLYSGKILYRNPKKKYASITSPCDMSFRQIHGIVGEYIYGKQPKENVFHHDNFKPYDNRDVNLIKLTRSEHVKVHYEHQDDYKNGLQKGRDTMKYNPEIKEQIRLKNQTLMKAFCKIQNIYKAYLILSYLESNNIEINEENYNIYRTQHYNTPFISTLIEKNGVKSFEHLIQKYQDEFVSGKISKYLSDVATLEKESQPKIKRRNHRNMKRRASFAILHHLAQNRLNLSYDNYTQHRLDIFRSGIKFNNEEFTQFVSEFEDEFVKITKIEIEDVEKEPMFDFTVDKFHNALILTSESEDSSSFGYIVAHNSSVYEALVRLTQPWKLNIPLIDGQGNFGSIEGDGAAAMRYTECKLSDFTKDVYLSNLEDIDYMDNYDGREKEPVSFIPSIPILLINGSKGIGTAIDTSIPPHNINEVIDSTIAFIMQKKEGDIVSYIKGPDFPTGGLIDSKALMRGLVTGSGSVYSICKTHIESSDYGRFCLVIDSIPYQTETTYITDAIVKGYKTAGEDSYFKLIADLSNETSSEGIRIVVKFKKGVDEKKVHQIEEFLRSQEILMKKINYSMNALTDKESFTYKRSIHGFLMEWYTERVKVKERYYERRLIEEKRKLRELEIIEIVIKNHKKIFDIIYNNTDDVAIHKELLKYISDLSLDDLDIVYKINVKKLKKKGEDIVKEVDMIKSVIALLEEERNDINKVIIKELREIKKKYGRERRSEII